MAVSKRPAINARTSPPSCDEVGHGHTPRSILCNSGWMWQRIGLGYLSRHLVCRHRFGIGCRSQVMTATRINSEGPRDMIRFMAESGDHV